jgi:hypothetical protein
MTITELDADLSACTTPAEVEAVTRKINKENDRQRESEEWERFPVSVKNLRKRKIIII